jgi:hypothetical protein
MSTAIEADVNNASPEQQDFGNWRISPATWTGTGIGPDS